MKERNIKIINRNTSLSKKVESAKTVNVSKKKIRRVSLTRLIFLIFIVLFIIFSLYAVTKESVKVVVSACEKVSEKYDQNKEDKNISKITEVKKVEVQTTVYTKEEVLEKIKELIVLPSEEISIFVKIKNPEELLSLSNNKNSKLYEGVKKDDYLLAYPTMAVLYDAKEDKLIKVVKLK